MRCGVNAVVSVMRRVMGMMRVVRVMRVVRAVRVRVVRVMSMVRVVMVRGMRVSLMRVRTLAVMTVLVVGRLQPRIEFHAYRPPHPSLSRQITASTRFRKGSREKISPQRSRVTQTRRIDPSITS